MCDGTATPTRRHRSHRHSDCWSLEETPRYVSTSTLIISQHYSPMCAAAFIYRPADHYKLIMRCGLAYYNSYLVYLVSYNSFHAFRQLSAVLIRNASVPLQNNNIVTLLLSSHLGKASVICHLLSQYPGGTRLLQTATYAASGLISTPQQKQRSSPGACATKNITAATTAAAAAVS